MPTIQRKVEVHRLTISGLPHGQAYGTFLRSLRSRTRPVAEMVKKLGTKYHALNSAELRNHRLRLRFLSYTKGHRPDVLDTDEFAVTPNPLSENQTNIEWTHVLGGLFGNRYVLLIERNVAGIWPSTLEHYVQWMVDSFHEPPEENDQTDREPVTVSLEAVPGPAFLQRVNGLDRVTEATVRIVRPNPGWRDLETELGGVAEESDAHKAEVHMNARRNDSLRRNNGIIQWIREKLGANELDYAAVKGKRGTETDSFNTAKLGKHSLLRIEQDDRGQVVPEDAWHKLAAMMDNLD